MISNQWETLIEHARQELMSSQTSTNKLLATSALARKYRQQQLLQKKLFVVKIVASFALYVGLCAVVFSVFPQLPYIFMILLAVVAGLLGFSVFPCLIERNLSFLSQEEYRNNFIFPYQSGSDEIGRQVSRLAELRSRGPLNETVDERSRLEVILLSWVEGLDESLSSSPVASHEVFMAR